MIQAWVTTSQRQTGILHTPRHSPYIFRYVTVASILDSFSTYWIKVFFFILLYHIISMEIYIIILTIIWKGPLKRFILYHALRDFITIQNSNLISWLWRTGNDPARVFLFVGFRIISVAYPSQCIYPVPVYFILDPFICSIGWKVRGSWSSWNELSNNYHYGSPDAITMSPNSNYT